MNVSQVDGVQVFRKFYVENKKFFEKMPLSQSRCIVIVGPAGSGKTEVAVNLAFYFVQEREKVAIVDLDFVNPYFRSREAKSLMEANGIKVVVSPYKEIQASELPSFQPEASGLLDNENYTIIYDVGGGKAGAAALARMREKLEKASCKMVAVYNPFRPFVADNKGFWEEIKDIEETCGLNVSSFVLNPNASYSTEKSVVLEGIDRSKKVLKEKIKNVEFLSVWEGVGKDADFSEFEELGFYVLPIKRYQLLPWEK